MSLQIGNKVKLVGYPGSKPDKYNPKDTEGVIISLTGRYNPIIVEWSGGIRNSYIEKYLELI